MTVQVVHVPVRPALRPVSFQPSREPLRSPGDSCSPCHEPQGAERRWTASCLRRKGRASCAAGGNRKWCSFRGKQWRFLKKLSVGLPHNLAIPRNPAIHPKELKAGSQTDTCIPMFVTVLLTIAKRWKKPKRPSTDEWKNHVTYPVEYYSAIKWNEILTQATTWMDLENTKRSEISQTQKNKYCMIPLT